MKGRLCLGGVPVGAQCLPLSPFLQPQQRLGPFLSLPVCSPAPGHSQEHGVQGLGTRRHSGRGLEQEGGTVRPQGGRS